MEQQIVRTAWLTAFGAVLVLPVLLRLVTAPVEPLWDRLAVVTGLLALSALVCAAVLPSRLRSLTRAFGIEGVLDVHRFLGCATAVLTLLHLACVVAADPAKVTLLDFGAAGPAARAASVATLALLGCIGLAMFRSRSQRPYEFWRWTHILLAAVVVVFAALHVWLLDNLVADASMNAVLAVLAGLLLAVLGYRWVWRTMLDPTTEFVVREVRAETATVTTLVLAPRNARHSDELWDFEPGQFAWIRLGRAPTAQEHPFTIASAARRDRRVEFTIRHAGDFTAALPGLHPGSAVWVDGPHGAFTPTAGRNGVVMIAGGVGVTPMMSMLRTAAYRGDRRPYRLVVVAARHDELLFRDELALLREQLDLEVTEVLRRPVAGWSGHTGEIGVGLLTAVLAAEERLGDLDYFLCGPPSLIADAFDALAVLDVPTDRVHTEQFDMV
ncbi:MAG: ferric reductase-like transmembrane domain-containing protein [Pseudonocardia sp.]